MAAAATDATTLSTQFRPSVATHSPQESSLSYSTSSSARTSDNLDEKDAALARPRLVNGTGKHGTSGSRRHRKSEDPDRGASSNRVRTFTKAFGHLYKLTPKEVDDFMDSYVIYSLDWANEEEMIAALGPKYQQRVGDCLKSYYGVLNHLCALGDVEKMYIPPFMRERTAVRDHQLLYEESIARDLGLKAGDKVLDLGCGRGRVAAHIAHYSGARITGLNIDPNSVAQAQEFNDNLKNGNKFVVKDFNDLPLPFEDASFDAFYNIQAFSLVKDLPALFNDIHRILKPGAKFSALDWVKLPAYDETNPEHLELMRRVKPLIGAVGTPTPEGLEKALRDAGFVVTRSDNASIDGLQAPLIDEVDIYFRAMRQFISASVKMHVLPAHFKTLIDRLCLDGQAFVKMDKMRLVTTSYRIIAEKPLVAAR